MAGFRSVCRPASRRNGGRLEIGIPGRLRRNTQRASSATSHPVSEALSLPSATARAAPVRRRSRAPPETRGVPRRFSGLSARVGFDRSRLRYVRHDQVVLGTNSDTRIVADDAGSLAARRLRACVEISEGDLLFRGGLNPHVPSYTGTASAGAGPRSSRLRPRSASARKALGPSCARTSGRQL